MPERLRVAQIGVGYWGPNLLRNLVMHAEVQVVCAVDRSAERQAFVRALYPAVRTSAEAGDVLDDPTVEAVVIATPVATHFPLVCRALEAGKHVLVEKPMARSVEEVRTIQRLAQAAGRVAMVGDTFLYNNAVRFLKELVDSGTLGTVRYITSQRVNLGRVRSDVDALWNFAPHDISIIQYLLDYPQPVAARRWGMAYIQDGIDDVTFLHVTYPHKTMAHIHVSWLDPLKTRTMTVVGSKKMVVYDDIDVHKIAIYDKGVEPRAVLGQRMDFDRPGHIRFDYRSGDVLLPRIEAREPLRVEIEHFVDCVRGRASCLTGPEHAASVLGVLTLADEGR